MTPSELLEHRVAALLGLTLGELGDMPLSEWVRWTRYWKQEPWGPLRDNMHAAIIAAKVHNMLRGRNGPKAKHEDFMLVDRAEHQQKSKRNFIDWLKAVGRKNGDKRGPRAADS